MEAMIYDLDEFKSVKFMAVANCLDNPTKERRIEYEGWLVNPGL